MANRTSQHEPSGSLVQLAGANNAFATHLYQAVQDEKRGKNIFFSPLSISTALSMTHIGARGDTATQIADVFRFSQVKGSQVQHAFKELNVLLYKPNDGYKLKAANKLYGKTGYSFVESFLKESVDSYDSAIEAVDDFASPAAAQKINHWVSEQTEGKITNLIAPGVLGNLTRLVLVNAIYFKGDWATKFSPKSTKEDVFKVLDDRQTVPVKLMIQSGKFPVAIDKTHDCLVLEMPYKGQDLSMVVVLPNKDDGLAQIESRLSAEALQSWSTSLRPRRVIIMMPKFKMTDQFTLNDALRVMGMPDAFDSSKANFEGISGNRELFISHVIHKAFVDVNEEGSEAAAATAVMMNLRCARPVEPEKPITFRADHPFLFIIRHRQTQAVLFMGRVMAPC